MRELCTLGLEDALALCMAVDDRPVNQPPCEVVEITQESQYSLAHATAPKVQRYASSFVLDLTTHPRFYFHLFVAFTCWVGLV